MLAWALLLLVITTTRLPETRTAGMRTPFNPPAILRAFRETVTNRQSLGYTIAAGVIYGALTSYVSTSQQVFEDVYGLGDLFPLMFGAVAISMGAASLTNGAVVQRVGMRRLSHGAEVAFVLVAAAFVAVTIGYRPAAPPLALVSVMLSACLFLFSFINANFNALAMEPLHRIAGTGSSFVGFFTTAAGATAGTIVGHLFDGTVVPLAIGMLTLSASSLVIVAITEKGRLFRPHHET
jgi:DHA1 family bicyclomycin/chloramphenicol resistance-like MFS transporter